MQLAVIHHPWVWTLCWAVTFVCLVALGYNENARRSYPTNCITLCIFTVLCCQNRLPSSWCPVLPLAMHPGHPPMHALQAHLCALSIMYQLLDHA